MRTVTPNSLKKTMFRLLEMNSDFRLALFVWGPPGIGKSDIVKQVGEAKGIRVQDIRLSQMDPTDLRGLPYEKDGVAEWLRPNFLDSSTPCILFLDELNHAPPAVQSAAYQLILDKRVGDFSLHPESICVGASNHEGSGIIGHQLPLPLKNRLMHVELTHDVEEWIQWAHSTKVDPRIRGYIKVHSDRLFRMPKSEAIAKTYGYPTPRSWEAVSAIIKGKKFKEIDTGEEAVMMCGCIGNEAKENFTTYLRLVDEYSSPEAILENPKLLNDCDEKSILWAIMTTISEIVTEDDVDNFGAVLNHKRLPKELAIYALSMCNSNGKAFVFDGDAIGELMDDESIRMAFRNI